MEPRLKYRSEKWKSRYEVGTNCLERLSKCQGVSAALVKVWQSRSIAVATNMRLLKMLVWPVSIYGCVCWTMNKSNERRIEAAEILRVPWTAKNTSNWV